MGDAAVQPLWKIHSLREKLVIRMHKLSRGWYATYPVTVVNNEIMPTIVDDDGR